MVSCDLIVETMQLNIEMHENTDIYSVVLFSKKTVTIHQHFHHEMCMFSRPLSQTLKGKSVLHNFKVTPRLMSISHSNADTIHNLMSVKFNEHHTCDEYVPSVESVSKNRNCSN